MKFCFDWYTSAYLLSQNCQVLTDWPKYKNLVSSAKWCTLQSFIAWWGYFCIIKIEEVPRDIAAKPIINQSSAISKELLEI